MSGSDLERHVFLPRHVIGWALFSASAGFTNASAVLACKTFVTHVTGTVTSLGIDVDTPELALDYVLVVASFLAGGMLAVLVSETLSSRPKLAYALPLMGSFAFLVGIAVAGNGGLFGPFGVDPIEQRTFAMLGVLAAAMGMANAAVAIYTRNTVRITHLTGPVTDLAGNIVRSVLGSGAGTRTETRWALLRTLKLFCFTGGAGLAARFASQLEFNLFAVAAGVLIIALGITGEPIRASAPATKTPRVRDESRRDESIRAEREPSPSSLPGPTSVDVTARRVSSARGEQRLD